MTLTLQDVRHCRTKNHSCQAKARKNRKKKDRNTGIPWCKFCIKVAPWPIHHRHHRPTHLAPSPSHRPPLSWEYAMPCPGGASNRRCFGTVVGPRRCPSHRPNQALSLPHGSRSSAPLEKYAWVIHLERILSKSISPWSHSKAFTILNDHHAWHD